MSSDYVHKYKDRIFNVQCKNRNIVFAFDIIDLFLKLQMIIFAQKLT